MIPKNFVSKYLEESKGCCFFGVPIEKLTRDELVACAVAGWSAEKKAIEESSRQREFLLSLKRPS